MSKQVEMVGLKKKDKHVRSLQGMNPDAKANVIRLLNRQSHELQLGQVATYGRFKLYIDPHSTFIFLWNLLYLLIFYLIQLQISLSLAFGVTFFEQQLQLTSFYLPVYLSFLAFLTADILLNFLKGYYSFGKGRVIDDYGKIIEHYTKNQFPYDILVVLLYVVPLIYESQGLNFLQLITAGLIWIKKFKYQHQIEEYMQYRSNVRAAFMLTILFIDVLMIGNYGACIFIGMDLYLYHQSFYGTGENSPYYWLTTNTAYPFSLIYGPWYYQYIYGQQYSTGTLSTLAPGPFGKNPYQIFYSILVMIFFVVLASYVAQVLIQIVYTYNQKRTFHQDNIISFDNFMQSKQVGKSIRRRVYNFFELIWQVELKVQTKEQEEMISKLPLYLREDLLLEIGFTRYLYFLEKLPQENTMKKMISSKIERKTVDSNTCFFNNLNKGNAQRQILFVKQGIVKFYLSKEEISLKKGQPIDIVPEIVLSLSNLQRMIGVYEFVTGQDYSYCCKSIDLCLMQTLQWNQFQLIIQELHLEVSTSSIQEEFQELKYRVLIERELTLINKLCIVCQQAHIQSECPQLYPKEKIIDNFRVQPSLSQNRRLKKKRKDLQMKKITSQQHQLRSANLFNMIPGLDIGQLIADFYKIDKDNLDDLEEVQEYHQFCREYNAHRYHWALIF